jgi:hypothetical protein
MTQVIARELSVSLEGSSIQSTDAPGVGLSSARVTSSNGRNRCPAPAPLRRHCRQSAHPGAAQQAKQQGFGLIVTVLAGQQHVAPVTDMNAA